MRARAFEIRPAGQGHSVYHLAMVCFAMDVSDMHRTTLVLHQKPSTGSEWRRVARAFEDAGASALAALAIEWAQVFENGGRR